MTPDDLEMDGEIDPQDAAPEDEGEEVRGDVREEPLPEAPLRAILEALLFASEEPVTTQEIAGILGAERAGEIDAALESLQREYEAPGRGLRVQKLAGGF